MDRTYHTVYLLISLSLFIALLFISAGCNSILPDEFQDQEYSSAAIDAKAGSLLARDTTGLSIDSSSFYIVNSRTLESMVDSSTLANLNSGNITPDEAVSSNFDALIDSLNETPLLRDSLNLIQVDTTGNVAYAVFSVKAGEQKDIYIYTSLIYNQSNFNEHVAVQLLNRDASIVNYVEDMPMEVVSASTQVVPGGTMLIPTIKARYHLNVEEGSYLVRFNKSAENMGHYIKIVILSL